MIKLISMFAVAVGLIVTSSGAFAAVQTMPVAYQDGETALTGQLFWDDSIEGKRPGVLVVHEWWGLNDYARKRASMLA